MKTDQISMGKFRRHFKSEFIHKLNDIIVKNPQFINWTDDGDSIEILEPIELQRIVIPQYFRHSNFESFLRQLHLYDFKQKKQKRNSMVFTHNVFKKGNQPQFFNIQRIKKKKQKKQLQNELQKCNCVNYIQNSQIIDEVQKNILTEMFSFKFITLQKQKSLKQKIAKLESSLSSTKSLQIKQQLELIRNQINSQLQDLVGFSKGIDQYMKTAFEQKQKELKQKKHQKQNKQENLVKQQQQWPMRGMLTSKRQVVSKKTIRQPQLKTIFENISSTQLKNGFQGKGTIYEEMKMGYMPVFPNQVISVGSVAFIPLSYYKESVNDLYWPKQQQHYAFGENEVDNTGHRM